MISVFFILYFFQPSEYIAVIGDTQSRPKIFLRAIKQMNDSPAKFLIHVGDQIGYGNTKRFRRFSKRLQKLLSPAFLVPGNHDISGVNRRIWRNRFGYKHTWQSISCWPYQCLLLDLADSNPPKNQLPWLEKELQKSFLTIWFHHRPLPAPRKFWPLDYERMDPLPFWRSNKKLWRIFLANRHKIVGVFHGHHHAFRPYRLAGIPIWNTGGGGGTLTRSKRKGGYYHWLLVKLIPFEVKVVKIK